MEVCPPWMGYLLMCPMRRWLHDPDRIAGPHVWEGATVLDVGCAMGYFSLPMARRVGVGGTVVCVDLQPRMLEVLERRAAKAGLSERIRPRLCGAESLGLEDLRGAVDFALLFAVVHEMPSAACVLGEVAETLAPAGRALVAEPVGHVTRARFRDTQDAAERAGLRLVERPRIRGCHTALFARAG